MSDWLEWAFKCWEQWLPDGLVLNNHGGRMHAFPALVDPAVEWHDWDPGWIGALWHPSVPGEEPDPAAWAQQDAVVFRVPGVEFDVAT